MYVSLYVYKSFIDNSLRRTTHSSCVLSIHLLADASLCASMPCGICFFQSIITLNHLEMTLT